jgi:hypothetical protein
MYPNAKGSELFAILATIDPASLAVGTVTTGWLSLVNFHGLLVSIQTGALGAAATLDAKLQQAIDAAGTSAKDITGKAIAQLTQVGGGSSKQALINLKPEDLDTVGGFGFVRLSITVGVAASLASAQVLGINPRFTPADAFDQVSVVQIVG